MSSISSSSSSSSWQHIKVNTDKIISQLKIFISILEQTRDPIKFNLWSKVTINKAFKWADAINKLSKTADQIQQDNIAKELKLINISFINKDCIKVLIEPVETTLKTILSSPILTWNKNATSLLIESLIQSSNRLGNDITIDISENVFYDIINYKNAIISLDIYQIEISYAFEFLLAISNQLVNFPDDTNKIIINNIIFDKIKLNCYNDSATFRILCRALTLTPSQIAVSLNISFSNNTNNNNSNFNNIILNETLINKYYQITFCQQLWDMIDNIIQENLYKFIQIELNQKKCNNEEYFLIKLICMKSSYICNSLIKSLFKYVNIELKIFDDYNNNNNNNNNEIKEDCKTNIISMELCLDIMNIILDWNSGSFIFLTTHQITELYQNIANINKFFSIHCDKFCI